MKLTIFHMKMVDSFWGYDFYVNFSALLFLGNGGEGNTFNFL